MSLDLLLDRQELDAFDGGADRDCSRVAVIGAESSLLRLRLWPQTLEERRDVNDMLVGLIDRHAPGDG